MNNTTDSTPVPQVYAAISGVMADLAKVGISKDSKNSQQGYNFRGIDDVYNALAPLLSRHHLLMLPEVTNREVTERSTKSGGVLFYVVLNVNYRLVSTIDGSSHQVTVIGEAMDSADKATNKAMSAAYKYLCLQVFCIPTQTGEDADETTHEVISRESEQLKELQEYEEWKKDNVRLIKEASTVSMLEGLYKAAVRIARHRKDEAFEKELAILGKDRKTQLVEKEASDETV